MTQISEVFIASIIFRKIGIRGWIKCISVHPVYWTMGRSQIFPTLFSRLTYKENKVLVTLVLNFDKHYSIWTFWLLSLDLVAQMSLMYFKFVKYVSLKMHDFNLNWCISNFSNLDGFDLKMDELWRTLVLKWLVQDHHDVANRWNESLIELSYTLFYAV